jgi:hypothetical protein
MPISFAGAVSLVTAKPIALAVESSSFATLNVIWFVFILFSFLNV